MDTNNFKQILINKNRGWRGLVEATVYDDTIEPMTLQLKMIFSFSQAIWDDLIASHILVMQDDEYYYVIKLNSDECEERLPKLYQQRSVLIKNAVITINEVNRIEKKEWSSTNAFNWTAIIHFLKNKNNHTTSDWNCIRSTCYTRDIMKVNRLERRGVRFLIISKTY